MNITPIRAPNEIDFSGMSISDDGNSPYINVRDYQVNFQKLTNDNFTLKLVLYGLYKDLRIFLKSNKIQDDVIDTLIEQENMIAKLTAEIGQMADSAYSKTSKKMPPPSPSLKQKLESALDLNRQLMSQLKEKENQQFDNVVESIVFDDGLNADVDNLELNRQIQKLQKRNRELSQQVENLSNDVQAYQKEKEQNLQTISDLSQKIKSYEGLENALLNPRNEKNELESQIAQLQRDQIAPDDVNEVMKQLEEMAEKNTKLLQENNEMKQKYQFLEKQQLQSKPNDDQNADNSEAIRKLTLENEKLKETNLLYQESTLNFYRKLNSINTGLKGKIQYLKYSIDRVNSGDYSYNAKSSISPHKVEDKTDFRNIDSAYMDVINEIETLTKESNTLNTLLDSKLYEKIDQLSQSFQEHRSPTKNKKSKDIDEDLMNEIVDKNAELLTELTKAQNNNLRLTQQVEIIRKENEDLTNENDALRMKMHPGSTSSILYTPNKNGSPIHRQNDDSLIEDLKKKNIFLENELTILRKANQSKQSHLVMKNQITTPIKRPGRAFFQNSFNNSYSSIDGNQPSLFQKMSGFQQAYEKTLNSFLQDFDNHYRGLIARFHRLVNIVIQISKSINAANGEQIKELAALGATIIQDMKKGATISIKVGDNTQSPNNPLFQSNPPLSRDDRKKLTMLQKKWNTLMVGDLGQFIKDANEKSLLLNDSSFIKNENNILNELFIQLKAIIESIWSEFGSGAMPVMKSLIDWRENGSAILQDTLQLFTMSVLNLRESSPGDLQDIRKLNGKELNPKVLSILSLVRKDVNRIIKQMHDDHQELIMIAQNDQ